MTGRMEQDVPSGWWRVWKYITIRGVGGRGIGGIVVKVDRKAEIPEVRGLECSLRLRGG